MTFAHRGSAVVGPTCVVGIQGWSRGVESTPPTYPTWGRNSTAGRYFRTHGLLYEADAHGMLSWQGSGGFSIDASVRIQGEDRAGVERLLRYCARPPFALERLYAPGGIVSLSSA